MRYQRWYGRGDTSLLILNLTFGWFVGMFFGTTTRQEEHENEADGGKDERQHVDPEQALRQRGLQLSEKSSRQGGTHIGCEQHIGWRDILWQAGGCTREMGEDGRETRSHLSVQDGSHQRHTDGAANRAEELCGAVATPRNFREQRSVPI